MPMIALLFMALAMFGALQAVAGLFCVRSFTTRRAPEPASLPPITVLKPVCGAEPDLEEALESFCRQDYPAFQLVIGAHHADDPALAAARRVQARHPALNITLVADPSLHGINRKISNLMNMWPKAAHDVLVFSDSDLHVSPLYLRRIMAALAQPGVGLVTTVCAGHPTVAGLAARLGASHLTHTFLPGAVLASHLIRQDCLGNTMALRRETLTRAGGLQALVGHVADDNVLGQLVQRQGLSIALAATIPAVSVPEESLGSLWQHELRWARTIRALAPAAFAGAILQFPLFWAALGVAVAALAHANLALCGAVYTGLWALRAAVATSIDAAVAPLRARAALPTPILLLPLRDVLSAVEIIASFCGSTVVWRGHTLRADAGQPPPGASSLHTAPGTARPARNQA